MQKYLLSLMILFTLGFRVQAQEFRKAEPIICPADSHSYDTFVAPRHILHSKKNGLQQRNNANIVVNYNGFTEEARIAFQYAVDIWSSLLNSPTKIIVNANFADLGQGVLGSAGPSNYVRDFPGAPVENAFYPIPLAEKLAGYSLNGPNDADLNANFSSTFNFYFGLDGNPPSSKFDFVSIVLHELGHGLGFTGAVTFDSNATPNTASWDLGTTGAASIFTTYTQLGDGNVPITDLPSTGTVTAEAFTSNDLFFNGMVATTALGENPRLYAPATWNGGSSFSHLDENTYTAGNPNSLMSPQIGPGEAIHDPGISLEIFADMGWVHTYMLHKNNNETTSNLTDPFIIELEVKSDTTLANENPVLHYTLSDFSSEETVTMELLGNVYSAQIPNPGVNSTIKYYIDGVEDILSRNYTSPSNAPTNFFEIKVLNSSLKSLPYLVVDGGNFESDVTDFIPVALDGDVNIWEKGIPTNTLSTAPSGESVWKTDLDANVSKPDKRYSSALVSPLFDFSNEQLNHLLSFKFSMDNGFSSGPFGFNIEYSTNNGTGWFLLGEQNDQRGTNWYNTKDINHFVLPKDAESGWVKQSINISGEDTTYVTESASYNVSFLAGNPEVQFRIVFYVSQDFNDEGYEADGLLVDDFEITTSEPNAEFITTSSGIIYAGTDVNFEYISTGATSFFWEFGDGSTSDLESPTHTYTEGGSYDITLTVQTPSGEKQLVKNELIKVIPIIVGAYSLADGGDLENGSGDFNILNVAGTGFEIGNSSVPGKNGTASGDNAIVTGINANTYQNDSEAFIYTPEFNLNDVGFYEISFETNYQFEPNWDGFIVEYTTNRGTIWTKLNNQVEEGWYNQISDEQSVFGNQVPIFSGTTNGSFEKKNADISFLQGVGNVGFRIKFLTDAAEVDAGMAFDNFEITYSEPLPVVAGFTATSETVCVNEAVSFINESSGSVGSVSWDFGVDATPATSNALNPTGISYSSTGLKTITLTVTDLYGDEIVLEKTDFIKIGAVHSPTYTVGERNTDFSRLLTASEGEAYQWYLNGDSIADANSRTYLAFESGNYTVSVLLNGCIKESISENVITANQTALDDSFVIYPNPTRQQTALNYSFSNNYIGEYSVIVFDLKGQQILNDTFTKESQTESNSFNTKLLREGVYIMQVQAGINMTQSKFIITN